MNTRFFCGLFVDLDLLKGQGPEPEVIGSAVKPARLALLTAAIALAGVPGPAASCPECGIITGTVVDATGAVVAGALVSLDVVPRPGDTTARGADSVAQDGGVTRFWTWVDGVWHFVGATTAASTRGEFWVDDLPEGIYTLRASSLGRESDGEPVAVRAGVTALRVVRIAGAGMRP